MAALASKLIRNLLIFLLQPAIDWLVARDILSSDETLQLIGHVAAWVLPALLALWAALRDHRLTLTALALHPGATLRDLYRKLSGGQAAPVMTPTDEQPVLEQQPRSLLSSFKPAIAIVLASSLLLTACNGGSIPTRFPEPTPETVNQVRVRTVQALAATDEFVTYANAGGKVLRALPISDNVKNAYDCGLAKTFGSSTPAPAAVVAICGAIPLNDAAPFTKALTSLRNVTTCPGLASATGELVTLVDPWVARVASSDNASAAFIALTLQTTLKILRGMNTGATPCSD